MNGCPRSLSLVPLAVSTSLALVATAAGAAPPVFLDVGAEYAINSVIPVREGETLSVTIAAEDPDGDPLTLSVADSLPDWLDFDPASGLLTGTAPYWSDDYEIRRQQPGKNDITIEADDGTWTVAKRINVMLLESGWEPRSMADLVASRPLVGSCEFGTPVELRHAVIDTIWVPYGGGKEIRRVSFGFTSQVPAVEGWDEDWVAELNHAYLPLGAPAVDNVGGIGEGGYARAWGDSALGMRACAELDLPTLVIDLDWDFGHGGEVMSRHNEKAGEERAPEYIFYVYSAAHYLRAMDALITVIDEFTDWPVSFQEFRGVFTGHSKFGHTCLAAAAVDSARVAGFMSAGAAGLYSDAYRLLGVMLGETEFNPEASPNYLGTMMKYYTEPIWIQYQADPALQALITQGTRDGVKFNTHCTEYEFDLPHRMGTIPNLLHTTQSPQHSLMWRMWLAHCFLGRPLSRIDSVKHHRDGDEIVVEASVSGIPAVTGVSLYTTSEPDRMPGAWHLVTENPMVLEDGVYRARVDTATTMYFVEVRDRADGVDGLISSTPVPVDKDYPILDIAPAPVSDLAATRSGPRIDLSWRNPLDEDFAGVLIVADPHHAPRTPLDGTPVYDGAGSGCTAPAGGPLGNLYYAAFSYDALGNYSAPARVAVISRTAPQVEEFPLRPILRP